MTGVGGPEPLPPETPTVESDRRILAAAPADGNDWDDETWAAWHRAAARAHGTTPNRTQRNSPLTPEALAAIAARVEAATPGPWELVTESCDCSEGDCGHGRYAAYMRTPAGAVAELRELPPEEWEFAAHARQDVRALLADNARLRARVDEVERRYITDTAELKRELDAAQARVDALEAAGQASASDSRAVLVAARPLRDAGHSQGCAIRQVRDGVPCDCGQAPAPCPCADGVASDRCSPRGCTPQPDAETAIAEARRALGGGDHRG